LTLAGLRPGGLRLSGPAARPGAIPRPAAPARSGVGVWLRGPSAAAGFPLTGGSRAAGFPLRSRFWVAGFPLRSRFRGAGIPLREPIPGGRARPAGRAWAACRAAGETGC